MTEWAIAGWSEDEDRGLVDESDGVMESNGTAIAPELLSGLYITSRYQAKTFKLHRPHGGAVLEGQSAGCILPMNTVHMP